MIIKVPNFYSPEPLKVIKTGAMSAAQIPLDPMTRQTLTMIDNFVEANVDSPEYKPLWKGDFMYVNFSRWCQYELMLPDGTCKPMEKERVLGKGMYSVKLQASHVYIGPHRGGKTYSVSLHIVELVYEPEQNLFDIFEDILQTSPTSTPPPASTPPPTTLNEKLKAPRKPKRKMRLLD